jgi:hypothetical protein
MQKNLLALIIVLLTAAPSLAQRIIEDKPIGPPINPNRAIQQQNQPQNLPPPMAPQPPQTRMPTNGPYPSTQPVPYGSSPRARQVSRARYECSREARKLKKGRRAAYINKCVAAR